MKTEPTELNKKEPVLAVNHMMDWTDEGKSITTDVCYKWLKIAFKEGQSNQKIKQLEWVEYENFLGRKSYFAKTPFTSYDVADGGDHFTMFSPNKRLRFASAKEAKAAAQADFEQRVRECLDLKARQKQALIDMMRGDEEIGLYDDNPKNH
jgi:hypothetical protein